MSLLVALACIYGKYLPLKYAASIPEESRFALTGAALLGNDVVSIVHAHK